MRPGIAPGLDALDDRVKLTVALATHFDPLQVLDTPSLIDDDRIEEIDGLAAACDEVEVPGSGYRHWSMRPDERRFLLRTMADRPDLGTLLDAIDVPPGDLFAGYLRNGLRGDDLGELILPDAVPSGPGAPVDLDALLRAVRFLENLPPVRTSTADLERRVRRQIALTEAEKALQVVVPARLVGREREYAALVEYRATELATDRDWVPSFVLVGPGGVGKSALVSKFVSDERRRPGAAPLIYLDFDRATLIDVAPLDLTFEFTRQLGLAELALDGPLADLRERSRSLLGGRENLNIDIGGGASSAALRELGSLLSGWPHRAAPVTIVLDTFEEVAVRGVTPVRDVLAWVAELRNSVQLRQIHLIVCGRAVVPDAPHLSPEELRTMFNVQRELPLEDLDTDKAVELLTELGVDAGLAQSFAPVFGGNPLVLKLIRRFVAANDPAEVEQLLADGRKARRDAPSGEVGLRFVYERILNRIKKPRVQALAYPGVVLRRVTPELILQVLVPACPGLDVTTPAEAKEVFDELAAHVWLVNRVAPDIVVHRADVRRLLVPGLEHSSEIDTEAIHVATARYYAARPAAVAADVAQLEEMYHRGFLNAIPDDLSPDQANLVVHRLAGDLEYWPVEARAAVKARAGRHDQLTEEEVASLAVAQQRVTRGARIARKVASSDLDAALFEEAQLETIDEEDETGSAIPDSRWLLLFERGDFKFMTESSRVLSAFERYVVTSRSVSPSSNPTHEHPWFIALAILIVEPGARSIFTQTALAALDSGWESMRSYGAALAALAGDRRAHDRIIDRVRREVPPRLDLPVVDDVVVWQAALSGGDLDEVGTRFQVFSCDHFRLPHLVAIAIAAGDRRLADRFAAMTAQFANKRPVTAELNRFRSSLAREQLVLGGADQLRAAPTTLSFLYGVIRTVLVPLERVSLLAVISELEQRSVFWPVDQTAATLETTLRATITPTDLTALIETADRCGLIVDLVDAASARTGSRLSRQLATGIRRIEGLLFPLAEPQRTTGIDRTENRTRRG